MTTSITAAHHLLACFQKKVWVQALVERVQRLSGKTSELRLDHLANPSVKALVVATLLQQSQRPIIYISADPQQLTHLQLSLDQLLGADFLQQQVLRYPNEVFSPYDLAIIPASVLGEHYAFMDSIRQPKPSHQLYLATARNLLTQFPAYSERLARGMTLTEDSELDPDELMQQLVALGYTQTGLIMEPGDVSRRGDIVDIYPVNGQAARLSFFGDTIESIKRMDPDNQRSIDTLESVRVLPRSSLVLTETNKEALIPALLEQLKQQSKALKGTELEGLSATLNNQIQALEQDFIPDGLDYYAALVHDDWEALGDCLPKDALLITDDWDSTLNQVEGFADRLDNQLKEGLQKGRLLDVARGYHLSAEEALSSLRMKGRPHLFIDPFPPKEERLTSSVPSESLEEKGAERFQADMPKAVEYFAKLRREGQQVWITTDYPQRMLDTCKEWDLPAEYWPEEGLSPEQLEARSDLDIVIARSGLTDGFSLPLFQMNHFSDAELFGRHRARRMVSDSKRKRKDDVDTIQSLSELRPGDYVVHLKHGIGQFIELSQVKLDGEKREYLAIQYKGKDKLFVPVDQLNLLSRYRGAGDAAPSLSKIGGAEWKRVKSKVQKSIQSIAKELVELYAKRQKVEGFQFEPDTPWQVEMEEAFPFQETPDQWKAICDVKGDMESDKPMDRLICGDVGFGKTEVALRAIFKSVLNGKQAAVLVPTTILAQQHFNTLSDRFQPYPVRVGLLSRFRSAKEQKELVERIRKGECDIVVGTHRILQKDIRFKDLGLLVIDEEHRFGVSHKEKIKHMRSQVDVMTMSATPIPRTLYMSLSGVREMTLINTPPTNRTPVQTLVGPMNPAQMRMAILHEIDRGGQVYYMHNRVNTIHAVAQQVRDLVPEVKVAVAHGQMNPRDLEQIMLDFANREYDVLLCTTIIESGVDIPNANTLVIDDADRYGLAQLYQIRGRVGRSETQAYAYLYYSPEKQLTDDAKNRLRAIREFTALGSGYQIAMRDMEIRGVGNILGAEQHGHMIQVGFDMYCEMLDEAVEAAKKGEEPPEELAEPSVIDLNVTAFIPDKWVGDGDVKLNEYKHLAAITTENGLDMKLAEWKDRFGPVPAEAEELVRLARLRVQASELGIPLVRSDDEMMRISAPYTLQDWLAWQKKLPKKFAKMRWVAAVRTSSETGLPTLQLKHMGLMSGQDMVEYLLDLFKRLKK